MKKFSKLSLLVCTMLVVALFAGCAKKFDASSYLQAALDNSYKNDPSLYVKQKVCTEEEANKIYEQGIDKELSGLTSQLSMSDDLKAKYRTFIQDIFKAADYTVKDAKKEDGKYIVTVEYKKLKVFQEAIKAFTEQSKDIDNSKYETTDAYSEAVAQLYLDLLQAELDKKSYGDTESTTVTIAAQNKVYTPNTNDLMKLELALFDIQ